MREYVKIKRKLYDELIDVKAKYVTICKMLETMRAVYEENKPKEIEADMRNTAKPTKEIIDKLGECKCNTCKHNGTWVCVNKCSCFDKYEGGAE